MPCTPTNKLLHTIGRWSLTALVVNMVIGSGIFGLPSILARLLGQWGSWAYLVAAVGIGAITACLAEVGSQFSEAGGPYLYARVAYGRFAGIQIAWLTWLVRLTSGAANANIFVEYLGGFFPAAQTRVVRGVVLFVLIGALAAVNIIGVRAGANVSSFFAVAKILPLLIFIVGGLVLLHGADAQSPGAPTAAPGAKEWLNAVLLIIFAMSGFEAALIPMGEARDARRDVPFALFFSLTYLCGFVHVDPSGRLAISRRGARHRTATSRSGARLSRARRSGAHADWRSSFSVRQSKLADAECSADYIRACRAW